MSRIEYIGYILLAFYCIFFTGCKKDENPQETRIEGVLDDAVASRKSAIVSGRFSGSVSGIQEFGFLYSTSDVLEPSAQSTLKYPISETFQLGKTYTVTLSNLEPGKTYYYCLYASNGTHVMKTEGAKFETTQKAKAILGEMRLDESGEYSLSISCSIKDDGGSNITQCGFSYKLNSGGEPNSKLASADAFKATIDGLSPGETYDVWPFAVNDNGMVSGDTIQFVTEGFEAPVVITYEVEGGMYGSDWAQLSGLVNNNGTTSVEEAGFCYTTEDRDPSPADKKVTVLDKKNLSYTLTGLKQNTTYNVRAFAKNKTKTGYGKTVKFTTSTQIKPECKKPEVKRVTDASVELEAVVTLGSEKVKKMGFCYSDEGAPSFLNGTVLEVEESEGNSLKATITGLMPGKDYLVCAFIENKNGIVYSESATVKTSADPVPTIGELTFSNIQKTEFTVQAKVSSTVGITKQIFLYSSTNQIPRLGGNDVVTIDFSSSATIRDLKPNTRYYVCAYVLNKANKEVYSPVSNVTTTAMSMPTISNITVTRNGTSVEVAALCSTESDITECGICYSTNSQSVTLDTSVKGTWSYNRITGQITGLEAATTYYVRVYAKSIAGIAYSDIQTVKGIGVPTISNVSIMKDGTSINVKASCTSETNITECGICYSKTNQSPTIDTSVKGTLSDNQISKQITELEVSTTYYIRVYAKNVAGIGYSETKVYVTSSNKPGVDDNKDPNKN